MGCFAGVEQTWASQLDVGRTHIATKGTVQSGLVLNLDAGASSSYSGSSSDENLLTYSEQFDNAAWSTSVSTVTANSVASPNGTTTADTFTASSSNTAFVYRTFSASAQVYTFSCFAKAGTATSFRLDFVTSPYALGCSCIFDLSAGTAGTVTLYGSSTGFTATIQNFSNGWYRCSISGTSTAATWYPQIALVNNSGNNIYIWGAQLERSSTANPYYATTDTARIGGTTWNDLSVGTGALPIYNTTNSYGTVKGTGTRTDANASSLVLAIPMDGANNGTTFTDESLNIKNPGALPIYNTTDIANTVKGTGTRTDAFASSLVLALPMDGANNGTTFTDESANIKGSGTAKTITVNGDTKTLTAQSKFYGSSGFFDGTGDYLSILSNSDFAFGTGDFTIEGWFYATSLPSADKVLIEFRGSNGSPGDGWVLFLNTSNQMQIYDNALLTASTTTISTNSWTHLALSRVNGTLTYYVNGVSAGSFSYSTATNASSTGIRIGTRNDTTNSFFGYIQDLRIYKGVAKYTSNFGVPGTSAKAITRFGDTKTLTAQSKFYGSSGFFDGSGDYLNLGTSSDYLFGTGDFTIEGWFYLTSDSTRQDLMGNYTDANTGWGVQTGYGVAGQIGFYYGNSIILDSAARVWSPNSWTHFAITRSGTSLKLFVNGVNTTTTTNSTNISTTSYNTLLGAVTSFGSGSPQLLCTGYLQDFRIYKGLAKYTSNFVPSGSPNNGTLVGSPTYSSANGGSLSFNGSSQYATVPLSSNFEFGTGQFAVEAWVNLVSTSTLNQRIMGIGDGANGVAPVTYTGWSFIVRNLSGTIYLSFYRYDGTEPIYQAVIPSFSTANWFHFVATRDASNTLTLYSNGVAISTTASVTQSYNSVNSQPLYLGYVFSGAGNNYLNGRIPVARIYKGKGLSAAEVAQNYNALKGRYV